jgi:hypothetical protein
LVTATDAMQIELLRQEKSTLSIQNSNLKLKFEQEREDLVQEKTRYQEEIAGLQREIAKYEETVRNQKEKFQEESATMAEEQAKQRREYPDFNTIAYSIDSRL